MSQHPKLAIVIVAAGGGTRAQLTDADIPKQYQHVAGKPLLVHAVEAFVDLDSVDLVLPVIGADHHALYDGLSMAHPKLLPPIIGGRRRQNSSMKALEVLQQYAPDLVLIHDAARPFVTGETIGAVCKALRSHDGAVPVLPVVDTIKRSSDGKRIEMTQERGVLWAAQTPQGFDFHKLLAAFGNIDLDDPSLTDDAGIAEKAGLDVVLVPGDAKAFKITTHQDFERAELMMGSARIMETRVGSGLDIHQFEPGNSVILGGVKIAHNARLKGHSDADAALHVLTDALLGALAEGDIGQHFPPADDRWKDTASDVFLSFAVDRVKKRGGRIVHLDLTIVCEAPKISPNSTKIRQNIAKYCQIPLERVSVKATTSEQMGFIGRKEGLMALATATIQIPETGE